MTPSLDARAREVARWLRDRFAEHPAWIAIELDMLARARGIALSTWWHHAIVREMAIRSIDVEVTPGNTAICWTVIPPEPEGSE